jgi:type VI secretion system VasD/TssJ family lipoprotein
MNKILNRAGRVVLLFAVVLLVLAGCSLFRGGEPKERTIQLTFDPSPQLNWDGSESKTLQVAVFILKDTGRFAGGQVAAFFDPDYDRDYSERFAADVVKSWTFTVRPGQSETQILSYTLGQAEAERLYLGIIGDFFQPADNGRERSFYTLKNTSQQQITAVFGKDLIESVAGNR